MKILIIGSGAVGGFIGARLIEKKCDVTFLVRAERKLRLVTRGLQLRSQFGAFRRPVHAITADEIRGAYDLVVPTAVDASNNSKILRTTGPPTLIRGNPR